MNVVDLAAMLLSPNEKSEMQTSIADKVLSSWSSDNFEIYL